MAKYFLTSITGEKFPALQAERFDHPYDLDLIVNYDDLYQGWAVSELTTGGKVVGFYDTKEEAIQALHKLVKRIGLDEIFAVREQAKNKVKQLESARQRRKAQAQSKQMRGEIVTNKGCLECGVEQTKETLGDGWIGIDSDEGDIGSVCGLCADKWNQLTDDEFDARIDQLIAKHSKSARHGFQPNA